MCISIVSFAYSRSKKNIDISVSTAQHTKMSIVIGVIDDTKTELIEVANILKNNFSFSGQFDVSVQLFAKCPHKKTIKKLFTQGYLLAVFITSVDNGKAIEWRIYDTMQATMVQGKKYTKRGVLLRGWAYNCADVMWPFLTGQDGLFSSKIAYCKEVKTQTGSLLQHICVADYDGSNEEVLVAMPTVSIAPRWNRDTSKPLLCYSEYTNTNVRLMSVDMHRKRTVASDFDGINMLPAFSQDGKVVVYCASRGDGSCQLYSYKKGKLQRLTHNGGNNVSPTFADNDKHVYFCSDFKAGQPQIYVGDLCSGSIKLITRGGYCTSPSYCAKRRQLAYTKMVKGTMQLYLYDCQKKRHTQLTADVGNKHECSWSPCGNYLLFSIERGSVERGAKSRLAIWSFLANDWRFLTEKHARCSYPAWSPCYSHYPAIV